MSDREARRARRAAASSARRLKRLDRARRRSPVANGATALVLVVAGFAAAAVGAAVTGRVEVPAPPSVSIDFAGSARATPTTDDLVVRIANGSGDANLTAAVAGLARSVGIHGFEVVDATPTSETRILVHRDTPDVVAAAADLRDLIGAGVLERAVAADHDADLSVVLGADARDPA